MEFAGTIPVGNVTSMAFDTSDVLYLVTSQGGLYRWSLTWPDAVVIRSIGFPMTGLAFSPGTNALWGSLHDSLFTIDTLTGAVTFQGAIGYNVPRSTIAFHPSGAMYGLYGSTLVMIDKSSRNASIIGLTGAPGLIALAMRSDVVTGVDDGVNELADRWDLSQNYPNPFNPTTLIRYAIGNEGSRGSAEVQILVYDLLGRVVAELVNERQTAGRYELTFDATGLASGMYVYRLKAGSFVQTRRMMLVK